MIYDKIENLKIYKSIYPQLEKAFEVVSKTDFSKIDFGIWEVADKVKIVKKPFKI